MALRHGEIQINSSVNVDAVTLTLFFANRINVSVSVSVTVSKSLYCNLRYLFSLMFIIHIIHTALQLGVDWVTLKLTNTGCEPGFSQILIGYLLKS